MLSRVYTDPGGEGDPARTGAGPPSFPPGRAARPTHLRGRQPRPHLPHQEGLQAAARGAEKPGARCRQRTGICRNRRHCGSGAGPPLGVTWPGARAASPGSPGGGHWGRGAGWSQRLGLSGRPGVTVGAGGSRWGRWGGGGAGQLGGVAVGLLG